MLLQWLQTKSHISQGEPICMCHTHNTAYSHCSSTAWAINYSFSIGNVQDTIFTTRVISFLPKHTFRMPTDKLLQNTFQYSLNSPIQVSEKQNACHWKNMLESLITIVDLYRTAVLKRTFIPLCHCERKLFMSHKITVCYEQFQYVICNTFRTNIVQSLQHRGDCLLCCIPT